MKKVLILFILSIVFVLTPGTNVYGKQCKIKNGTIEYIKVNTKEVWVTQIKPSSSGSIDKLVIPSKIEGKAVVKLGALEDDDCCDTNIFGIYPSEDVEGLVPIKQVELVKKIKQIVLPDTLKEITSSCFNSMSFGKTINIPALVTENVQQLCNIEWKEIIVSPKNKKYSTYKNFLLSKDHKTVYGYYGKDLKVIIPEKTEKIAERAFYGRNFSEISIPKSVKKIGKGAFDNVRKAKVYISLQNPNFFQWLNIIIDKRSYRIIAAVAWNCPRAFLYRDVYRDDMVNYMY